MGARHPDRIVSGARAGFSALIGGIVVAGALAAVEPSGAAAAPDLMRLSAADRAARTAADAARMRRLREGLGRSLAFVRSRPDLFPPAKLAAAAMPSRDGRGEILGVWKSVLDHTLALDSLGRFYEPFFRLDGPARAEAFAVEWAAFLARYRFALEFIRAAETNPALAVILDEPIADLGLPAGSYARYKFLFLNVAAATRYGAFKTLEKVLLPAGAAPPLGAGIAEDAGVILEIGRKEGQLLTAENAWAIVGRAGYGAWFPVQAGVSEWMGDTKVRRKDVELISQEQIAQLHPRLRPGDILLERREWYLSNIGLPGFWPHAALYVGTPAERRAFFRDPAVREWVRARGGADGDLETLLSRRFPAAYALAVRPQEQSHIPRVLEAMSEGVVFTTLEHSAACDSLAVLRPRLRPVEIAEALVRAFGYSGRPYDFDFDFLTDAALVCTELIYKAYEPAPGYGGLRFPLAQIMGKAVTPANEMVRRFDEEFGTARQQTDLVLFLDGRERGKKAVSAPLEEFRLSWRRPKWHVLVQETPAP